MRSSPLFILVALSACSSFSDTLTAEQEMLLSTTSGAEEALASRAALGALTPTEDPDQPPLFRECDAEWTFTGIREGYDRDQDGGLSSEEQGDCQDAHAGRDDMEERSARMRMAMLGLIYDTGEDGSLSDAEKAPLYEDFTARCEALHAMVLAEFDADGDGALSDEELATAESTLSAERDAAHAEMEERMAEERGELGPPPGPPEPGSREVPPGMESYDTDSDGLLSDTELATLREALRAKIRSGEPMVEPPPEG